jgi:hypothetical protein
MLKIILFIYLLFKLMLLYHPNQKQLALWKFCFTLINYRFTEFYLSFEFCVRMRTLPTPALIKTLSKSRELTLSQPGMK